MFLAHLVGDYVLQWDALAQWKSRELKGVIVHSAVLFVVTALFALPIAPGWWQGVVFIGVSHFAVDAAQFFFRPTLSPLLRFFIDQLLHLFFILLALVWGGYLTWGHMGAEILAGARQAPC